MRKLGSKKRFVLIASVVAAILVGSGVAFAYWSVTGTGTGTASTASSTSGVTVAGTTVSGLYPGITAQAIPLTITNPNPGKVAINSVVTTIASVTTTAGGSTVVPGCTAANFTVTNASFTAGTEISPGSNSFPTGNGATIAMLDTGVSQDACKGVFVNLTFALS
jgi:archaellin